LTRCELCVCATYSKTTGTSLWIIFIVVTTGGGGADAFFSLLHAGKRKAATTIIAAKRSRTRHEGFVLPFFSNGRYPFLEALSVFNKQKNDSILSLVIQSFSEFADTNFESLVKEQKSDLYVEYSESIPIPAFSRISKRNSSQDITNLYSSIEVYKGSTDGK
jgi:hypothetical protein